MRSINGGLIESRKRRECVAFHVLGTQTWLASEISIGRTRTIASMNQRLSTEQIPFLAAGTFVFVRCIRCTLIATS